jgi:mycothiol synthase
MAQAAIGGQQTGGVRSTPPVNVSEGAVMDGNLVIRPYAGEDDIAQFVRISNAEAEADGVPNRAGLEDMLAWARHPSESSDPARDLTLAEIDGQPVAFGERGWVDNNDGATRIYWVTGAVLPEWRRRGIGAALLAENERRARALAATHDTDRERLLTSWSSDRSTGRVALLRNNGYEPERWYFEMIRPLSEPIADVPLPEGLEVRPVTTENIRQVWAADAEAFHDHWGGFDMSDEQLERTIASPTFDPSLWVVGWEGDEVAGGVVNVINGEENEALGVQRGWLDGVFTRRPWRRRGLAGALVARSLSLLRDRGLEQAVLGVDADNPTGALGLYERNGFVVAERSTAWRKSLEA